MYGVACVTLCGCQTTAGVEREELWPERDGAALSGFVWVPFDAPMSRTPEGLSGEGEDVGVLDPWSSEPQPLRAQPMEVLEDLGAVVKLRSLRTDEVAAHCPAARRSRDWEAVELHVYVRREDLLGALKNRVAHRFDDGTGWSAVAGTPVGRSPTGEVTIAEGRLRLQVKVKRADVAWSYPEARLLTPEKGNRSYEGPSALVLDGRVAFKAAELDPKMKVVRKGSGSTLARVLNVMSDARAEKLIELSGECVGLTVSTPKGYVWTKASMSEPKREVSKLPVAGKRSSRQNPRVVRDLGLMSGMRLTWRSGEEAGRLRRAAAVQDHELTREGSRWCFELSVFEEDVCVDPSELP